MKILYISNKPIFPLLDGGCVAMNQFLKCLLEAGFDVKNLTISTQKHPFSIEHYPEKLASIIRPEHTRINTSIHLPTAVKYLFKKGSYNIDRFINPDFKTQIKNYILNHDVDFIIIESIYLGGYLSTIKKISSAKILIRTHNVEFMIWNRLALNQSSILKRIYFKKLAKDLKKVELAILQKADGIACITRHDKSIFKDLGITTPMTTIPVAIDKNDSICDYSVNTFYHLGSMNWNPNIEAVRWLVESIFPSIRKQNPNAKLILGGSFMPKEFQTDEERGIEVVGYVENMDEFMTTKGILLAPLKSGSGVRIKLLESMSMGVPVVTTIMGAEGIDGEHGKDFFIASNEVEFIQYALELSNSEEKRTTLGTNAKTLVENHYEIKSVKEKLIEFIKFIS